MQVRGISSFFLEDFLGCKFVKNPARATQEFLDVTEEFIATVESPERRARYEIALLNQMHSTAVKEIDPLKFAQANMDRADSQAFLGHLKARGIGQQRFPKDTAAIETRIRRLAYNFESGIRLFGKPEAMDAHVTVENAGDGTAAKVTIEDQLEAVRARG
jgi:hypothetical protein